MRKNKKLLCICLILIASWLLQAVAFSASLSLPETTANQVVNLGEKLTLEFEAPVGDKVYILVDGKKVGEMISEGENSVELTEMFPLGEHCFEVVSENDSESLFGSGKFTVMENGTVEEIVYEGFDDGTDGAFSHGGVGAVGTAADSETSVSVLGQAFEGPSGGDDKAFGFILEDNCTLTTSPAKQTLTYNASGGLKREKWNTGKIFIEYDMNFFKPTYIDLEAKSGDGKWAYFAGGAGNYDYVVHANGKIGNTGNVTYSDRLNTWLHFKHVLDFDNNKDYLYVGETALSESGYDYALAYEGELPANSKETFQLVFIHYMYGNEKGQGFAFDNFNVSHQPTTLGFRKLSYISNGSYKAASDNVIPEKTNKIKLSTTTPLIKNETKDIEVDADYDGKSLAITSALLNDEGELEITFKNSLPASGRINLNISLPLERNGEVVSKTKDYFYSFDTGYENIVISEAVLSEPSNGNKEYFLNEQLTGSEKNLNAAVKFNSALPESTTAILAVVLYDGDKLVEMNVKNVTIPSGEGEVPENITFSVPNGVENPKAEIYVFDSLTGINALTRAWSLK